MDFKQNYYEIFQLPAEFRIDTELLAQRYRQLQRKIHPDKYVDASEQDRRMSMQWATQVNEAYTTLKSSLPRAMYLLKLNGIDMGEKQNAPVEPAFLMEQIELREDLESIAEHEDALSQLDEFKAKVREVMERLESEFEVNIEKDLHAAEQSVLKMQFMNKLMIAAEQLEEKLLDY
ncbi:MAG: Fe-S protein assembly co-chaperone HscB [Pseudomonadales bacterium]